MRIPSLPFTLIFLEWLVVLPTAARTILDHHKALRSAHSSLSAGGLLRLLTAMMPGSTQPCSDGVEATWCALCAFGVMTRGAACPASVRSSNGVHCVCCSRDDVPEDLMRESGISSYPVSVEWEPPFTMLTTLRGVGDQQARAAPTLMRTPTLTLSPLKRARASRPAADLVTYVTPFPQLSVCRRWVVAHGARAVSSSVGALHSFRGGKPS